MSIKDLKSRRNVLYGRLGYQEEQKTTLENIRHNAEQTSDINLRDSLEDSLLEIYTTIQDIKAQIDEIDKQLWELGKD